MRVALRALSPVCISAVVAIAACHGGNRPSPGGAAMMQAQPEEESPPTWVALAHDPAPCGAPAPGGCGWLLHVLNAHGLPVHVDRIDLAASGLDAADAAAVENAPDRTVLLDGVQRGDAFVVRRAFRALPLAAPNAHEVYVQVVQRPDVHCASPACGPSRAVELNVDLDVPLPALDLSPAEVQSIDQRWLTSRVYERGAVLAGTFTGVPGGRGIARFQATQVFVPLPDRLTACPPGRTRPCPRGTVEVFARDADRCLVSLECSAPSHCANAPPDCAPGYALRTWRARPGACPDFACDPGFLPE